MSIFTGAGVALVTPMKENLEVNYDKLDEILEWQIAEGTDAIIICGTTGESATLSEEEHANVIRFAIERVNHRIPVIAGTGSNCTATAVQLSKEASEAGAEGVLVVTPYYNKATQNGLIAHYKKIASEITAPIILYNVPSRTGCGMTPQTIATLIKDDARAGKLDGQKVGELAKADASQAIDHKVARVAPAAPGVHQLAPVAHTVIDAQNHTGQKQPDGHQPGGIHALAGKQILPHAAGNTPAHAAEHCQQSAFYAICHSL